jgi:hypothetical protein
MFEDVFIAVYTNECKSYCDELFFNNLLNSNIGNASVNVVDNSVSSDYYNKLKQYNINLYHIDVDREDKRTLFLRNVTESVLFLRDIFLKGKWKYFVILESDVIPEKDWLSYFIEVKDEANIIGGIYYAGFHQPELWWGKKLIPTHHVLSGCAFYHREIIEKFPFRWSVDDLNAFPDAWICYDYGDKARISNYTKIKCSHLSKENGSRGHEDLK